MMKDPKPLFVLLGVVLLVFIVTRFVPWQALILIAFFALIVFAFLGHLWQAAKKEQSRAILQYQPPQQQSSEPEPPPRTNPPLGFDLTPQEYQLLSQHYQQGYQTQAPQQPPKTRESAMPKQDRAIDYEQPQAQYPEQMPPMA